ncbi:MAG TPA: GNAT family N-acetyltransferase [Stellaceae bacterium]|jgi:ribosomal protein S18 acetylase RimI-like enzyme|nr:GNAT family N-acetyltransferase [Stellaceae bacterium]
MTAFVELRRLKPEDAAVYREIRLEALADSPNAFAGTLENERDRPLDAFAQRLTDAYVVGAFAGPRLAGVAGFSLQAGPKHGHKGVLWGMYVRPAYRGAGIGRVLVEAIIAHARQRVELLQLSVVGDNAAARRLYAGLGFVEYGLERHATKYRGQYHDDVLMALPLMVDSEQTNPADEAATV